MQQEEILIVAIWSVVVVAFMMSLVAYFKHERRDDLFSDPNDRMIDDFYSPGRKR